jgi:hypothetical protein
MSEYLEEAVWREHYRDLVAGVRMIREALEEALGPAAPLQPTEYTTSSFQECEHLAAAIASYADKMKRADRRARNGSDGRSRFRSKVG